MLGYLILEVVIQNILQYHIAYILIDKNKNIKFFCDLKKISLSFRKYFKKIEFLDIKICSKILSEIKKKKFIIDKNSCSYFFENIIRKIIKYSIFTTLSIFLKQLKEKKK